MSLLFFFNITNEERKYLGLNPIEDFWDTTSFYSKTNLWHKRTTVFWEESTRKKIIIEQKRVSSGEWDMINQIRNNEDFHDFMRYYMDTCVGYGI